MAIGTRSYARGFVGSGGLPPGVKGLLIANVVIFLIDLLLGGRLTAYFGLVPSEVIPGFRVWELAQQHTAAAEMRRLRIRRNTQ